MDTVLDAAIQVLREVGHTRCTTTRVADKAGVSVGTLYQYFPNRDALLYAVKRRYLDRLFGAIGEAISEAGAMAPEPGLQHVVHRLLQAKIALAPQSVALAGAMADVGDRAMVREVNRRARMALGSLLDTWGIPTEDSLGPFMAAAAVDGILAAALDESRAMLEDPVFERRLLSIVSAALLPPSRAATRRRRQ